MKWFGSCSCVCSSPRSDRPRQPGSGVRPRRVVLAGRSTAQTRWTLTSPTWGQGGQSAGREAELAPPRPAGVPAPLTASDAGVLIGYARCSTDKQDLTSQRQTLRPLGVSDDRMYLDHGMTGRYRSRPGLQQALAAVRAGDTLVVPKLDRLARSVPDARAIGDSLAVGGARLSIGGTVYDSTDTIGKMFFNILATFAEFEVFADGCSDAEQRLPPGSVLECHLGDHVVISYGSRWRPPTYTSCAAATAHDL